MVNNAETCSYRAGKCWSEQPGAIHSIFRYVHKTEPAKQLANFVVDTNDRPPTLPNKASR